MQDCYMNDVDMLDDVEHNANGNEDFGIPTKDKHVTIVNNEYVVGAGKKFVRTMLKLEDGSYVTARINMETGEIKPYNYAKKSKLVSAKPKQVERTVVDYSASGDLLDYTPSWLNVSKTKRDISEIKEGGKKAPIRKSLPNPNRVYLEGFSSGINDMQDACAQIPFLEDILFGVTHLDCGNSRPFSMTQFFYMLRDLEEINVETIYAYTDCGEKHCWRLAQYMRVLVTAFNRECNR